MRPLLYLFACSLVVAQTPDPAYDPLSKAYAALQAKNYDEAIAFFLKGIEAAPARPSIRKDLAYTYLKVGEPELARDQFGEAMRLEPKDFHVALEYAFLCYETKEQAKARRIFDRIRQTGDDTSKATAEQAFQNIDQPLKTGIERWRKAIEMGSGNFSAHFELATLAEQRDQLELAAEHYLKAWRLLPDRKSVLLDLGRVYKTLNRLDEANAALLAASRGGEPRAAESARELLPVRYPHPYEFRRALALDPKNVDLRRELAYLLLKMENQPEAEREFKIITETAPDDLLSAAQLGFLYLARKDMVAAMPLLNRVLQGYDRELANRVRATLNLPPDIARKPEAGADPAAEAKKMAERSYDAGFMKDALKYLTLAHNLDPVDFQVMLKLGFALNMMRNDPAAIKWFGLARLSPDAKIAAEAKRAYEGLRPNLARLRTTAWLFPFYSSRWKDIFSYGQVKTELRVGALPFRPYISTRFVGDTRRTITVAAPQYLSESSFIFAFGLASRYWHRMMAWGEAGTAVSYLGKHTGTGHMMPDYRGGVAYGRGFGEGIGSKKAGLFFETNEDAVFVSRFGNDGLFYSQNRAGWKAPNAGSLRLQFFINGNVTSDAKRQYWANFAEVGPGVRFRLASMPPALLFSVSVLRGAYLINEGNPRRPNFYDLRAGFWYAFTR